MKKIAGSIIGLLFLSFLGYVIYNSIKQNDEFVTNGVATTATILNASQDYKGRLELYYSYTVDNRQFSDKNIYPELSTAMADKIIGKKIPLIYWTENPQKSILLVSTKRFQYAKSLMPDSLYWIKQYEK